MRRRWFKKSPAEISAARRQGWETRRKKYGPRGHNSSYSRSPVDLSEAVASDMRLARLVAYCLADGVMTEGQVARVIEVDRLGVRHLRDDGLACLTYRPLTGAWGGAAMKRMETY